jgi:hypothetical protein
MKTLERVKRQLEFSGELHAVERRGDPLGTDRIREPPRQFVSISRNQHGNGSITARNHAAVPTEEPHVVKAMPITHRPVAGVAGIMRPRYASLFRR